MKNTEYTSSLSSMISSPSALSTLMELIGDLGLEIVDVQDEASLN